MRYQFIAGQGGRFSVKWLCRLLRVSKSGYYKHLSRRRQEQSERSRRRAALAREVWKVFHAEHRRVGARMIMHKLRRLGVLAPHGRPAGIYLVRRLMREQGLQCIIRRRRCRRPNDDCGVIRPNLLAGVSTSGINQAWTSDITQIDVIDGTLHVCLVEDVHSRRLIGWEFGANQRTDLVLRALASVKRPSPGTIMHSDRGAQYTSNAWQEALRRRGLVCSMSATGNCYDNAGMERLIGTMKDHNVKDYPLTTADKMIERLSSWIARYNHSRLHSALGYLSPAGFERNLTAVNP